MFRKIIVCFYGANIIIVCFFAGLMRLLFWFDLYFVMNIRFFGWWANYFGVEPFDAKQGFEIEKGILATFVPEILS